MRKIFTILLLLPTFFYIKAQPNNIYFIQAHVFDDLGEMFQFNNYLYKLNNQSLDTIIELSSEKEFLKAIKLYPEQKKAIIYKDGWKYNNEKYLMIIDFANPNIVYKRKINYLNYSIIDGNLIKSTNDYFVMDLYGRKENPKSVILGINLNLLTEEILNDSVYKSIILGGVPGGIMRGEDFLMVYTSPSNGNLYIPKSFRIEDRPIFPISIPDSLQLKKKESQIILINNERSFVITMGESEPNSDYIGSTQLVIKNKVDNHWFGYKIKGNYQVIRGFGKWLAGTVVDENKKFILDERGVINDKHVFNRISPGLDERRKKESLSGTTFDTRANYVNLYFPGILYLLNIETHKYIELNTNQGDSEILLVEDEIVYYRINDRIYKAMIIEGKKVGEPKLIIKDDRVPDIHWAFTSEK